MADKYTTELAETVVELFGEGTTDPNAEEIAEAHFPEKTLGREIESGIAERLIKIRNVIEEAYEIPCALVSETYYVRYRDSPPATMHEAYACIPGGWHKKSYGIRRQNGDDDLIWRATIERVLISAAGKEKKGVDRVLSAVALDDLSSQSARDLLGEMRTRAEPERQELARKLYDEILQKQKELSPGGE